MTGQHTAPGLYPWFSIQPRELFYSGTPHWYPSTHYVSSSARDTYNVDEQGNAAPRLLRAGVVLAKLLASPNYYTNYIAAVTTQNAASGATTITVGTAAATHVSTQKANGGGGNYVTTLAGPPAAGGTGTSQALTVTGVDTNAGTLTVSALTAAAVQGSIIATAGTAPPSQFITANYGVPVYDLAGNSIDQTVMLLRDGDINSFMIVGYDVMDAGTRTYLKNLIRTGNPGAVLTFSDDR